jgi:plasmid stabilization system protein ParE
MPVVVKRPRALDDLAEIWAYIADDSVVHADAFADLIDKKCTRWRVVRGWVEPDRNWAQTFAAFRLAAT